MELVQESIARHLPIFANVIVLTVVISLLPRLTFLFQTWRLKRRLRTNPEIGLEELRDFEWRIGNEPKPLHPLRLLVQYTIVIAIVIGCMVGLDLFFQWAGPAKYLAVGAIVLPVMVVGMAAALAWVGIGTLRNDLPEAFDAIDADRIRMKGHMFIILAGVIIALTALFLIL